MTTEAVVAHVAGEIFIPKGQLDLKALEDLRAELRFENPKYKSASIFGGSSGGFDRYIDTARMAPNGMYIPRGAVRLLTEIAGKAGQTVHFEDGRVLGAPVDFKHSLERLHGPGAQLYPYQEAARGALTRHVQACAVAPCGAGKSAIGLATIAALGRTALVLVHTGDLMHQWAEEIKAQLNVTAGLYGRRRRNFGEQITVGMVQAFTRKLKHHDHELRAYLQTIGTLLLDEAHHVPAATFLSLIGEVPARNRLGLTATPKREDGLGPLVELVMGQNVWQTTFDELAEAGYLMRPTFFEVDTGRDYAWAADYRALIDSIIGDHERSEEIAGACARQAQDGHTVLVISASREHVEEMATRARDLGARADFVHGKVADGKRKNRIAAFKNGKLSVLVATKVADEGLNIPRLDRLHLTTPQRSRATATQRAGRTMRLHKNKTEAEIYEWVDRHRIAQNQWVYRRAGYRKEIGKQSVSKQVLRPQDVGRLFLRGLQSR